MSRVKSPESVPEYRYRRPKLGFVSAVQRRACASPWHSARSKAVRCQSLPTETALCVGGEAQRRAGSPGLHFSHDDMYGLNKRAPGLPTGAQRNYILRAGGVISATWTRKSADSAKTWTRSCFATSSWKIWHRHGTAVERDGVVLGFAKLRARLMVEGWAAAAHSRSRIVARR